MAVLKVWARLLAVLVVITLIEVVTRTRFMGDEPKITVTKGAEKAFTVLLPGAQVTPKIFDAHRNLFLGLGDVMDVDYNLIYDRRAIVSAIVPHIPMDAPQVLLVGDSMGGKLSLFVAQALRNAGYTGQIDLLPIDPPLVEEDLYQGGLARVASHVPFGSLSNWALAPLLWRLTFRPGDPSTLPQLENRAELDALWWDMRHFPLSAYQGELEFVVDDPPPGPTSNTRAILVRSTHDDVVRDSVEGGWEERFPGLTIISVESKTHASLLDWPANYREAFVKALKLWGLM